MVFQTVRSVILANAFIVLAINLRAVDTKTDVSCVTTTSLKFTEREACKFDDMAKDFVKITTKNEEMSMGVGVSEKQKYGKTSTTTFKLLAKLDQAKSLMLEKSSLDVEKIKNLILTDTEAKKLESELLKIGNDNQIIGNNLDINKENE